MAAPELSLWIIPLAGSLALCELLARARVIRLDHRITVVAGGLVGLACVSILSVCAAVV